MPVPTVGNFSMFGGSNTTIQGAIVEGGGSAGALTNFNSLISFSNINLFDPLYAGDVVQLNEITRSNQYRNYPKFFTTANIYTNLGTGFSSGTVACSSSGNLTNVYLSEGGVQSLNEAYLNGKRLWANTSLTTPYNGGNLWFKTSANANSGDSFQVGTDGFIQAWGAACTVPSSPSVSCGSPANYSGGVSYPSENSINVGSSTGTVSLSYDPQSVPDRYIVIWNSVTVIDTGYRGAAKFNFGGANRSWFNGQLLGKLDPVLLVTYPNFIEFPDDGYPLVSSSFPTFTFNKNLSSPTFALVRVYAPASGTQWGFTLSCPT
jgi:hypothetical protein